MRLYGEYTYGLLWFFPLFARYNAWAKEITMKTTTLRLPQDLENLSRRLARRRKTTLAGLIRDLLTREVQSSKIKPTTWEDLPTFKDGKHASRHHDAHAAKSMAKIL